MSNLSTPEFAALSQIANVHYQIFMKPWQIQMPELSAVILFLSIFTSLSTFFTTSCITLPKIRLLLIKKDCFFPISAMYMLASFAKVLYLLGIFLAYFHFDNVCNCVCCFCCATALYSVCVTAAGFLFWIPFVFWIPSHAMLLSFVISLILLDNFFCLENFSLLSQELILRILPTLYSY